MTRNTWTAAVLCLLLGASRGSGVTATRGPVEKDGQVLDANGIWLENDYLKLGITQNEFAGQVMSFVYKPTGHELGTEKHPQGFCKDRMGEDRYFWKPRHSEGYSGRILSQSEDKAEAEVSYVWNYDHNAVQTRIGVTKTYVLPHDSATLFVTWQLENLGDKEAMMTPWVKNLGGHDETLLNGPRRLLFEAGPTDPGGEFVQPATDWVAKLSSAERTEELPMVVSVMDYAQIFQQFCWTGKVRYTLETILNRVHLKPGESWRITYALGAMANLGNVSYASPELAASVETEGETLEAGKAGPVKVHIAAAMDLGEKRIEGELLDLQGELVEKLPNRQVTLVPGRIDTLEYAITPPRDGAYELSLTVFDDRQQIVRLGQAVNSQRSSVTLPLAAGPAPEVLVRKWESGGFSWPRRKEREVTPWRTVLNGGTIKAAQVLVPERVFPEDRFLFGEQTAPAFARAAKGEYESIQIVVELDEGDVMALEPSVETPAHADGTQLESAELFEAFYLTTDTPSGYKNFPVGEWPDPLFRVGWHRKVSQGQAAKNLEVNRRIGRRVFWLVMKAPREGPAGIYRGVLELALAGKPPAALPVEMRVNTFAIPKRATFRCSTGMVSFSPREWTSSMTSLGLAADELVRVPAAKALMDRYRELVLEYGWTPTMWFGPEQWKQYYDFGRGVSVFPSGRADKETEAWLQDKGLLKYAFVYAPFDEHADVEVPEVAEWCREWKKTSEIPILDCYYGSNVEPLFDLVDVWLGQHPQQDWAKERKQKGDRFVACNSSLIWHVEFPPINGRAAMWDDFAVGYDGRYVYSTCRWTEDTFTKNWTSGNWMGCVAYPAPSGVTTSIRLETMRDGVEDYDYLAVLRERLAAPLAHDANAVWSEAVGLVRDPQLVEKVRTVEDLHALRDRMADLIEALGGSVGDNAIADPAVE